MAILIGSAAWAMGSADRKHTHSTILFRTPLPTRVFMTPAYGSGSPFGELKVTRRTGVLRDGLLSKIRMTRQAMFPLVFTLALASVNFGPSAVWHPPASFRQAVVAACGNRGADFGKCFADQMKTAGASAEALAFTNAIHDGGYMQAFRPVGQIAVASVMYPFRANENSALLIVNGAPAVIDVD